MGLPERIRATRREMLLGPAEFARVVGVSDRAIYYWEKGERTPNIAQIRKLVAATGKDSSFFLDDTEVVA